MLLIKIKRKKINELFKSFVIFFEFTWKTKIDENCVITLKDIISMHNISHIYMVTDELLCGYSRGIKSITNSCQSNTSSRPVNIHIAMVCMAYIFAEVFVSHLYRCKPCLECVGTGSSPN